MLPKNAKIIYLIYVGSFEGIYFIERRALIKF